MTRKESELSGSLYGYVQSQLSEINKVNKLATKENRRKALEQQVRDERLLDAPDAVRELFARFSVRELLTEVQTKFWSGSRLEVLRPDSRSPDYWGLKLEMTVITHRNELVPWYSNPGTTRWLGPGGGDIVTPGIVGGYRPSGRVITEEEARSIRIFTGKSDSVSYPYDLFYEYLSSNPWEWVRPKKISIDENPEILKQIIGEQLVKERTASA